MIITVRLFFALLALTAIGQQLVLHIGANFSVVNFFSYFTNLSNLLAALVLLISVFGRSAMSSASLGMLRYASVVNMTVVGLVFAALLRNVDLGGLLPWVNFVLHYVMPIVIVLDWLMQPPATKLQAKHLAIAFVFPCLYIAYVVLRGASMGWYPYPFLNPANVGGYGGVAMYALGITITFFIAAWALLAVGNRLSRGKSSRAGVS
jgi:hypothetical protein